MSTAAVANPPAEPCASRHRLPIFALIIAAVFAGCDRDRTPVSPASQPGLVADVVGGMFMSPDPTGQVATLSTTGSIDLTNPFFQSLGTNGRSCASCHLQSNAWGLTPQAAQAAFAASGVADPLFAAVDGANCPSGTAAAGAAGHSLLLNHGLIRIGLPIPASAEFTITAVHDPYACALEGSPPVVSVYRRPLPTANLAFLSAVMIDGRETLQPLNDRATFLANLKSDLAHHGATQRHRGFPAGALHGAAIRRHRGRAQCPGGEGGSRGARERALLPRHQRPARRQSHGSRFRP